MKLNCKTNKNKGTCGVKRNSKELITEDFGLTLRGLKWFVGPTQIFWSSKTGYTL